MKTQEIADFLEEELWGDGDVDIVRVAEISKARDQEIAFIENTASFSGTNASCLLVPLDFARTLDLPVIKVKNPKLAFARIAEIIHPRKHREPTIHASAVISPDAAIGTDVFIGAFVCVGEGSKVGDGTHLRAGAKVGDNVSIGTDCVLDPNVFVEDGCAIGDRVVLHSGVVIGGDGFGYVRDLDRYVKFPQIGTVVIEDDVEIGPNTCVDRGALGETRISQGTKIDNLVQVGHNVQIGRRCVIAAQTGISGSTVIEDDCVIGGQVGFGDHARVQSGAVIGSQAGVLPGKIVRPGVWWGTPIQPLDEFKRQNAHVKGLERMKNEIKELKRKLLDISQKS